MSHGLKVGEPAPSLEVTDLSGRTLNIGTAHPAGLDTLVVFVSPSCPVCKSLLPALRSIRRHGQPRVDIVLASDGSRLEHTDFIAAESLEEFTYVLSEALGCARRRPLPHAVLIDGAGIVGRAAGQFARALDSLSGARERNCNPAGLGKAGAAARSRVALQGGGRTR